MAVFVFPQSAGCEGLRTQKRKSYRTKGVRALVKSPRSLLEEGGPQLPSRGWARLHTCP